MELKTLKDLIVKDLFSEKDNIVRIKDLKQAAIEWIRYARRCKHQLNMSETFKTFFEITEEDIKLKNES